LRSDTPVRLTDESHYTLEAVVRDSLANFDINQEMEFTAAAYSRWLPPTKAWVDRHGERHTFDDIVDALLRQPANRTACSGTHTPYALGRVDIHCSVRTDASCTKPRNVTASLS
jgi:hypothetical protein